MTTTFDPAAKSSHIALSGGNLTATQDGTTIGSGVKCTPYLSAGKWYWEITVTTIASDSHLIGIANASAGVDTSFGADTNGYTYYKAGTKFYNNSLSAYGASYTTGDVISVLFDVGPGTLIFWKNGVSQGTAFTGITGSWTPAVQMDQGTPVVTANFGVTNFTYAPPAGYFGPDGAGVPDPGAGEVTSEPMTAYGARLAAGAVTSEPMTAVGGMNGYGAVVSEPMTGAASGGHNGGAVTMAAMTADVTGRSEHRADVTMEAMAAAATGYDQAIWTVAATVPAPTLSCTVLTGEVITFAGTAPKPTLECHTKDARLTAPVPTLSATLLSGTVITVTARVAPPILVATLVNPAIITASMIVRPPRLSAVLLAGNTASAILTLRAPSITAQILTGNVATVLATVAAPIMAAAGYPAYTITFAGTVPAPRLSATLSAAVTAAFRTWVTNLRKGAITEYSNFEFNSYAVFNNVVLGCTSSGIVELGTQSLDNATAISATVTSGKDNFASSVLKRIPRIYISYTTGGDARFALTTTEGGTRTYALDWNRVTGVQQRRIPVGRGPKSVRWQWSYTNVDGADFDLGAVLAYPTTLRRRVV